MAEIGNLVAVPEIRGGDRQGERPFAVFTIAKQSRRRDQAGNWVDGEPTYIDCFYGGYGAENLASLAKGTRVVVVGSLKQDNWVSKAGEKRSKLKIVASEVAVSLRFGTVVFERAAGGGGSSAAAAGGSYSGADHSQGEPSGWFDDPEAPF